MAAVTNATLIMGDSGSGKSSLLATLAEWGWKKYKKVSLLYSTDGGGFPSMMDALIRAGIVRVWKLGTRGEAFESCSRACQGFWPIEFTNALAGEVPHGVKLVKSVITTFTLHCSKCETPVVSRENRQGFGTVHLCPKCGARVNLQTGFITDKHEVAPFFKDVGIVMYDGLTSMNEWIMEDMADKSGRGELKGETAAIGGKIISGDMIFGGSNRSHYGFAQTRTQGWLKDAANIQGLIIGPVFTARKQRATDTNSNIRVYGPQIAGQAKTSDVPAWVGNCLGATKIIDEKGRKEWRLYLTEYKEPGDEIIHLCKTRAAPGTMPDYLSDGLVDPSTGKPVGGSGKAFTEFNLGHFFNLLEAATEKTLKDTLDIYPDAPGLDYLKAIREQQEAATASETTKPQPPKPQLVAKPVVKPVTAPPKKPPIKPGPAVKNNILKGPRPLPKNNVSKRPPPRPGK